MYLTLLRHEERPPDDPRFFTSLTSEGTDRASTSLVDRLYFSGPHVDPIDVIYCSPFLRTVQTVFPFARTTGLKIRIEPALYEFMEDPLFTVDNWKHTWMDLPVEYHSQIDTSYQPIFPIESLQFRESWDNCFTRTETLLTQLQLLNNTSKTHRHPLLVTHLSTINSCLRRWEPDVDRESYHKPGIPTTVTVTGDGCVGIKS